MIEFKVTFDSHNPVLFNISFVQSFQIIYKNDIESCTNLSNKVEDKLTSYRTVTYMIESVL